MQRLVGKTINFEDQEVKVYYHDEVENTILIYHTELGMVWLNCCQYEPTELEDLRSPRGFSYERRS